MTDIDTQRAEVATILDTAGRLHEALDLAERPPAGATAALAIADQLGARYREDPDNPITRSGALLAQAIALAAAEPTAEHREALDLMLRVYRIAVRARLEMLGHHTYP